MTLSDVGIVGLHEAGNLGDDLILAAAALAISEAAPRARIHFVGRGEPLNWDLLSDTLSFSPQLHRANLSRVSRLWSWRAFSKCQAIIFGGGGLLQSTHHPLRPYHWLRFLGLGRLAPAAVAVGISVGPLDPRWPKFFSGNPSPFAECFVRDGDSLAAVRDTFGWPARRSSDFVDGPFLRRLGISGEKSEGSLGVALRAWPGLDAARVGRLIDEVAQRVGATAVRSYVLESHGGTSVDARFAESVAKHTKVSTTIVHYDPAGLVGFVNDMATCATAISMKLHSSAIWDYTGATIFPILYAPKVASFFGRPYAGLEVLTEPTLPAPSDPQVPRAHDVVVEQLLNGLGSRKEQAGRGLAFRHHCRFSILDVFYRGRSFAKRLIRTLVNSDARNA